MKAKIALAVLAAGLLASSAQAGIFGGGDKLPKPESLLLRQRDDSHKQLKVARSLKSKYASPSWGNNWNQIFRLMNRPIDPRLKN